MVMVTIAPRLTGLVVVRSRPEKLFVAESPNTFIKQIFFRVKRAWPPDPMTVQVLEEPSPQDPETWICPSEI